MLLAIDSATRMLSLALHDGQRVRIELSWETANQHTVELTPAIQEVCRRAGIGVPQIARIAVSQGPGSFSGLRIGIGVAKGLAMALSIPLIAVPTLDIVAAAQPGFKGTLAAVAQAGRGRVAVGHYQWRRAVWTPDGELAILAWDALIANLNARDGDVLIAGEIDSAGQHAISASAKPIRVAPPALCIRRAAVLADLALAQITANPALTTDPAALSPIYVNQPGVPHP